MGSERCRLGAVRLGAYESCALPLSYAANTITATDSRSSPFPFDCLRFVNRRLILPPQPAPEPEPPKQPAPGQVQRPALGIPRVADGQAPVDRLGRPGGPGGAVEDR